MTWPGRFRWAGRTFFLHHFLHFWLCLRIMFYRKFQWAHGSYLQENWKHLWSLIELWLALVNAPYFLARLSTSKRPYLTCSCYQSYTTLLRSFFSKASIRLKLVCRTQSNSNSCRALYAPLSLSFCASLSLQITFLGKDAYFILKKIGIFLHWRTRRISCCAEWFCFARKSLSC